jgi:hypothetical protein
MKDDEPRHFVEMRLPREPNLLEVVLRSFAHFESVHGNEHDALLRWHWPQGSVTISKRTGSDNCAPPVTNRGNGLLYKRVKPPIAAKEQP